MSLIILTAVKISPAIRNLSTPKVINLESAQVVKTKPYKGGSSVLYGSSSRPYKKYRIAESTAQMAIAQLVGAGGTLSLDPYAQDANMGLTPAGSTQAAASAVSTYLTVVSGGVAASNSVKLPSASTWASTAASVNNGGIRVIINTSAVAVSVFPQSGEYINKSGATAGAGASNVAVSIPTGGRLHFWQSASDNWKTATETGE